MTVCCICFEERVDTFTLRCSNGNTNTISRHYCSDCSKNYCFVAKGCPFCRGEHTHEKDIIEANFSNINSHINMIEIIRMNYELWVAINNTDISNTEKAIWACESLDEILEENGYPCIDIDTRASVEDVFEELFNQS